ncbi:alpha/beta-hydrolase [Hypoxylon rubiginosum]|uniref:Alpha/beta-hydrolase n=1 Tax=Hypoxylon rubiginosum TaxID=110542 RepID=A0ACB9YSH2_9PEZI|nr:alpha/beta-hydrolase [Hypoxylon rubiginosum]
MNRIRAVRRRLRLWHGFAVLAGAVAITAAVLAAVLVTRRNHEKAVEADKNTPSDPSRARVNLGYAQYQGSLVGTDGGVAQYLGLRYAAAPTGGRRWRAPAEPEVEDAGDRAADTFGPICLGIAVPYPNALGQDEDCLFANVWAPANATVGSKLPVWLFIQGGGYTVNSNANWNGTAVVERSGRNIVFVNFNYRVGLWGFLASERVRTDGAGDLNVGLLDQREVMRWVRRHIPQFGGDPDHVVIHGASAGAGSVALHLVAYGGSTNSSSSENENEKLFVGAVGESVFFPAQPFVADLEWQFDRALTATGCDNDDPMACLRSKDTATLQAANVPSAFPGRPALPLPLFYWTPCIDGDLLRDLPYLLFERGEFIDVPVIMGATSDEGTVFASDAQTPDDAALFLQTNYPKLTDSQAADVLAQYPQMAALPMHSAWFPSAAAAYGEATFVCPASYILDAYAAKRRINADTTNTNTGSSSDGSSSCKAWGYRTNIYDADNAAQGLGVPHIWECWAIFGPDSLAGVGRAPASYYTYAADVVGFVMDYWISFVRTLDPSARRAAGAPVWEAWDSSSAGGSSGGGGGLRLVVQAGNFTMEAVPTDQRERCEFWRGLVPATQQRRI